MKRWKMTPDGPAHELRPAYGFSKKTMAVRAHKGHGVFLAVDRPMIREGLAHLIRQANFEIVGQAGDAKETLAHSGLAMAETVVVDFLSSGGDVLVFIRALHERQLRSVVCSEHGDSVHIEAAFDAGANGYVTQDDEPQHLIGAIQTVAAGSDYLSPKAGADLARRVAGLETPLPEEEFSRQERHIYELLSKGDSTSEIAARVYISSSAVEACCHRMIEKLDLPSMKALRRLAITTGSRVAA